MKIFNILPLLFLLLLVGCADKKDSQNTDNQNSNKFILSLAKDDIVIDSVVSYNPKAFDFSGVGERGGNQIFVSPGFFPADNFCKLDNQLVFLVEQKDIDKIDAYKKAMSFADWQKAYELSLPEVQWLIRGKIKTPVLLYVSVNK